MKVEQPTAEERLFNAVNMLALVEYVAVLSILVVSIQPLQPPLAPAKLAPPQTVLVALAPPLI